MANALSQLINNAVNTLASAITNVQTTVTVGDASLFPLDGDFRILVGSETMLVTSVTGDVFTVTRGVEGTSATAHDSGSLVKGILSEGGLIGFEREHWIHSESLLSGSPRFSITAPATRLRATVSDFTWVNQGTATGVDKDGNILITKPTSASGNNFSGLFIAAPTPPYSIVSAFHYHGVRGGTGTGTSPFPQAELTFRESSTSKLFTLTALPRTETNQNRWNIQVKTMTDATTFLASKVLTGWNYGGGPIWFKIEDNNTNLLFHTGPNGIDWIELYSETRTTHMATGPNQVGFGINHEGAVSHKTYMELLHFGR